MFILENTEQTWKRYFLSGSLLSNVEVLSGNEVNDKNGPTLICFSTDAEEVELGSGIYRVTTVLNAVYPYSGSNSLNDRNDFVETLHTLIGRSDLQTQLNNNKVSCSFFDVTLKSMDNGFVEDCWRHTTTMEAIAVHKS